MKIIKRLVLSHALWLVFFILSPYSIVFANQQENCQNERLKKIQSNRDHPEILAELLPIVQCSFYPNKYERILMTQLRDQYTDINTFRQASQKLGEILISKVIECLPTRIVDVETPLIKCEGEILTSNLDLVSIMRSGDALLDIFTNHFPNANVNKILIQRDETSAKPIFKYMKLSNSIASGHPIVITEPMIATGGTLEMVISLLKKKGVREENIVIACVCAAPEGLLYLNDKFPNIKVVMTVLDERLNEKKYIVPGLGDFGDRYFGTISH